MWWRNCMSKPLLIVFLRKPELGKVKTRLAATVGDEKALAIYCELLEHTLGSTTGLQCTKQAWYAGEGAVEDQVGPCGFLICAQVGNDLGERMLKAFTEGFEHGYGPVMIIGTDCPGITSVILKDALASMEQHDAVLGPARDGGYYLLGLKAPLEAVFQNKEWSTSSVAKDTLEDLELHGRSVHLLPELIDVDTEQDLRDTGMLA